MNINIVTQLFVFTLKKMDNKNLILLTLDLEIPDLWENDLVKTFPDSTFTIKQAHPLGDDLFSGLIKIENAKFEKIQKFLLENHPLISLETFHEDSNIFHYTAPDNLLPGVIRESKAVLSWPVKFLEKNKRIKLILKEDSIESAMQPIESSGIEIKRFSKIRMDFNLKELLTPKQKEILTPSLKHGYYDFPKKISLNNLSKKIGVSPSTLCVHLQKIESKILNSEYQELFL